MDKMKNTATPHEGMFMLYFFFSLRFSQNWHYSNAGFVSQAFSEWHFNVAVMVAT